MTRASSRTLAMAALFGLLPFAGCSEGTAPGGGIAYGPYAATGTPGTKADANEDDTDGGSTGQQDSGSSDDDDDDPDGAGAGTTTTGAEPSDEGSTGDPDATTQGAGAPFEGSPDSELLVDLVNAYRLENGLGAVPRSNALMLVAQAHAEDLHDNRPDAPGECNMHSWSSSGPWSSCCYTPDHAQANCMWDKPRELTAYTGNGYENAAGGVGPISADAALNAWKTSGGHNAVILNQGTWADDQWQAMGAAVYGDYAVLWFGKERDPS